MNQSFTIFSFDLSYWGVTMLSLLPALLTLYILIYAVYSAQKTWIPYTFAIFTSCLLLWQLSSGFMHLSPTLLHARAWSNVFIAGILILAPVCMHFVLQLTSYIRKLPFAFIHSSLYVPAFIFYVLYQLGVWHFELQRHPLWNYYQVPSQKSLSIFVAAWMSVLTVGALVVLIIYFSQCHQQSKQRKQAKYLLIGLSIPVITAIVTQFMLPVIFNIKAIPVTPIAMISFPVAALMAYRKYALFSFDIESHWKKVIDSHHQGVIIMDLNMVIQYCNTSFEQMSRYNADQVYGKRINQLLEDCPDEGHTSSGHMLVQSRLMKADGTYFPAEFTCLPFHKQLNQHVGFICFVRDISEQKIVESLLEDSEKRYNAVIKASPDAIVITDQTFNIINWNKGAEEIFGYSAGESYRLHLSSLLTTWKTGNNMDDHHQVSLETGKLLEEKAIRKDGHIFPTEYSFHSYTNKEDTYYCFIIRDVSLRKLTELYLVKANSDLNTFIYRASHDLRGPVATLMGILQATYNTDISREQLRSYLDMINTTTLRMNEIIDEFLQIAEVCQHTPTDEYISLQGLLDDIIENLKKYRTNETPLNISYTLPNPPAIRGDRQLYSAIFSPLISNAIKYTNHNKANIQIIVKSEKEQLSIKIHDNGEGISEDISHKIFNMFFRGNTKSKGAGLGLFIVQLALDRLNGTIDFESTPGKGTTFSVDIPYDMPYARNASSSAEENVYKKNLSFTP